MDGDDFKRQQVRHLRAVAADRRAVAGTPVESALSASRPSTPSSASPMLRRRCRRLRGSTGCRRRRPTLGAFAATVDGQRRRRAAARRAATMAHSAAPVLHVDERPLGGEHDAEDDQHQRAADVDDAAASRRRSRRRAGRRCRRCRQGEQQPGRGADDVLRHHDRDGADAGQGGERRRTGSGASSSSSPSRSQSVPCSRCTDCRLTVCAACAVDSAAPAAHIGASRRRSAAWLPTSSA